MNPSPIMGSAGLGTSLAGRQLAERTAREKRSEGAQIDENSGGGEQEQEKAPETRLEQGIVARPLVRVEEPAISRADAREMLGVASEQIINAPAWKLAELQPVWQSRILPSAYI